MSFVFIPFSTDLVSEDKFTGIVELIETEVGPCIVVASSFKDPRRGEWEGSTEIEKISDLGIPESALRKYGSPETLLKLEKESERESEPVEVPIGIPKSLPDVKRCPFCWSQATTDEADEYTPAWISCDNENCRIQPNLTGRSCDESLANLTEIWNTRPNE